MKNRIIKVYDAPPITPEEIAEFREEYGTGSQQALAEKFGVSRQIIYNWEHPERERAKRRKFTCAQCGGTWKARRITDPDRCKICKSYEWGAKSDTRGRYKYHSEQQDDFEQDFQRPTPRRVNDILNAAVNN